MSTTRENLDSQIAASDFDRVSKESAERAELLAFTVAVLAVARHLENSRVTLAQNGALRDHIIDKAGSEELLGQRDASGRNHSLRRKLEEAEVLIREFHAREKGIATDAAQTRDAILSSLGDDSVERLSIQTDEPEEELPDWEISRF